MYAEDLVQKMQAAPKRLQKANGWFCFFPQ